ncbi:hypothetical protein [Neptuniibacter sp. CAU 1671]|uniref:hypothetical protein n=1 Tax=Neptuniibacter sp. CAU 1671 TaxID=3032593 RepID=UPI0023DB2647|nr:hypothetical protein [Neptuniibacter sp. CAU 1671]MDF2181106.1 hypothetical protein [Neptuniibacter sp. CAU 1671]
MLTYRECLDLSDLTAGEVAAIAEHEHVDNMIAMAVGHELLERHEEQIIRSMILDDLKCADRRGDRFHAAELNHVLAQFVREHR